MNRVNFNIEEMSLLVNQLQTLYTSSESYLQNNNIDTQTLNTLSFNFFYRFSVTSVQLLISNRYNLDAVNNIYAVHENVTFLSALLDNLNYSVIPSFQKQ